MFETHKGVQSLQQRQPCRMVRERENQNASECCTIQHGIRHMSDILYMVHYRSLSLRASAWPAAKVEALEMRNLVSCLKRKRASWRKKGTSGAQVWQHQSNNDPNVQYRTVANINKYLACSGSNCSSLPIHGDP